MSPRPLLALAVAMACGLHTVPAGADPAASEAAFVQARALMQQARYAEACPKFEASQALDPAVGTLLNLGECLTKVGRTASAWLRYREAAAMALQQNQQARETIARERAKALEDRLCHLVVRAPGQPHLVVRRDGVLVGPEALGLPVPVDPGDHFVEAESSGAPLFSRNVHVAIADGEARCADTFVDIPLSAAPPERAGSPKPPPLAPIDVVLAPPAEASPWRTIHTLAIVAATAGVVGFGIGTGFALSAASKKSDSEPLCPAAGCTPDGKTLLDGAGRNADVATAAFIAGGALLVGGAVMWFVSPSLRKAASLGGPLRF